MGPTRCPVGALKYLVVIIATATLCPSLNFPFSLIKLASASSGAKSVRLAVWYSLVSFVSARRRVKEEYKAFEACQEVTSGVLPFAERGQCRGYDAHDSGLSMSNCEITTLPTLVSSPT